VRLAAPAVKSIQDLQQRLSETARSQPPGTWIVGIEWDELTFAERRAPTRAELDAAVPDHPLFAMHYSCHRAAANSRALELAGIGKHTPDPFGGVIERDANGHPSGLLVERGMSRVEALARAALVARDVDGFLDRLGVHYQALVRAGITRLADAAVPGDLRALYREAQARGLVTLPTVLMPVSVAGYLEPPLDVFDWPLTGEREGNLVVGPVKLILDGAPACALCMTYWQTAVSSLRAFANALRLRSLDPIRASLSVRPTFGRDVRTGIHVLSPEETDRTVRAATERGFGVACHAEGNEAIGRALTAYEAYSARLHGGGRARLEHVLFAGQELAARIGRAGAAAVMQPHFLSIPTVQSSPELPGLPLIPLRTLLDAGVTVAGSSDFPVTGFDPLDGIRSAVSRRCGGGVREAAERVSLDEAFGMYTREAARVLGCLDQCGTLEKGKRADVVFLDRPIRSEGDLEHATVARTVVEGRTVFVAC